MTTNIVCCYFCHKEFNRNPDLTRHQKTTKYCLEKQGKIKPKTREFSCSECSRTFKSHVDLTKHQKRSQGCGGNVEKYSCSNCGKSYTRQDNLKRHEAKCQKASVSTEIKDRNVIFNNLEPITTENIKEHLDHLSLTFIRGGAKGYADFGNIYPLKGSIICTDRSRKRLRYKLESNEITDDCGAKLAQTFFEAITTKNREIIEREYLAIIERISNGGEMENVVELMKRASNLQELMVLADQAAKGHTNALTEEFLRHLVKLI